MRSKVKLHFIRMLNPLSTFNEHIFFRVCQFFLMKYTFSITSTNNSKLNTCLIAWERRTKKTQYKTESVHFFLLKVYCSNSSCKCVFQLLQYPRWQSLLHFTYQVVLDQNYVCFTSMLIIFQIKVCSPNKKHMSLAFCGSWRCFHARNFW